MGFAMELHNRMLVGVSSLSVLAASCLVVAPVQAVPAHESAEPHRAVAPQKLAFKEEFHDPDSTHSTRVAVKPKVQISRAKKNSRAFMRLMGISGPVVVKETYRVKSKKRAAQRSVVRKKNLTASKKWDVRLRAATYKVRVSSGAFQVRTVAVPKRKFKSTKGLVTKLAAAASHANDFSLFAQTGSHHETCSYQDQGTNPSIFVTKVLPSNVIYYGGTIPEAAEVPISHAMRQVEGATGFKFVRGAKRGGSSYIDFNVTTKNASGVSGYAGVVMYPTEKGGTVFTSGFVNMTLGLRSSMNMLKNISMHELGHAMGLGHAKNRTQIMYPYVYDTKPVWGAGDRIGLFHSRYRGCRLAVGNIADYAYFI